MKEKKEKYLTVCRGMMLLMLVLEQTILSAICATGRWLQLLSSTCTCHAPNVMPDSMLETGIS